MNISLCNRFHSQSLNILAEFFAGGIISLIKWWLLDEPNYSLEDIRKQLSAIAMMTLAEYCA